MESKALTAVQQWKGKIDFSESLKLQERYKPEAKKGRGYFFGFESKKHVITMGLRSNQSHILWPAEKLKQYDISIMELRRGGEATLHSPGQLVIYPVFSLSQIGLKVRDFIAALEKITQNLMQDLGIETKPEGKYAGLYTKKGKLCFFGLHISQGVSQHGLSINVDNDLILFNSIKSCGESGRQHDSLSSYQEFSLSKEELFSRWCEKAQYFF